MICGSAGPSPHIVCYHLTPSGAEKAWELDAAWNGSTTPAIHGGHAYIPTRRGPILCVDMASGEVRGKLDANIGMAFNVVCGDRLLHMSDQSHLKGDLNMLRADPQGFGKLGVWNGPLAGAYTTPITAPFLDGRVILRLTDRLACYDLRQASAVTQRPHAPPESAPKTAAPPRPPVKPADAPDLPTLEDIGL
jgi:hypothetical protein